MSSSTQHGASSVTARLANMGGESNDQQFAKSDIYFPGQALHNGLPPNMLFGEARMLEDRLTNISDEDLYRIYHSKWVNRDLSDPNGTSIRSSYKPPKVTANHAANLETVSGLPRRFTISRQKAIEEYFGDQKAILREKLLSYMIDPDKEDLDAEPIMGALFPNLEDSAYPAIELQKFEEKTDELDIKHYAVWNSVRQFYFRDVVQKERLYQEIEPRGGIQYNDPISSYEHDYDPLTRLLRSVDARQGRLTNFDNPKTAAMQTLTTLYDETKTNQRLEDTLAVEKELNAPPKTTYFLQYAKAKLARAKQANDTSDIEYWSEVIRPFEYVPKEEPIKRPIFIEIPHREILKLGFKNTRTPQPMSRINFDYVATTVDEPDKIIDSTYRNGQPIKMIWQYDHLPKCLSLMLTGIPEDTRLTVRCPPRLLFGNDGWPQRGYPADKEIMFDIVMNEVSEPMSNTGHRLYGTESPQSSY